MASISVCCINPHCPRPHSQQWGNKFCQSCGTPLLIQGRYVPVQKLGSGGFAVTYTVLDLKNQKQSVLKVLLETTPQALRLFEQEAQVLSTLRHPGIPKVEPDSLFSLPVTNPHQRLLPCLVMEKINGQTLEEILDNYPNGCPEVLVESWLYQAVDILQVLHRRQIIHRDLKPANLMLRRETQQLVTIDFGGVKQIASSLKPAGINLSTRLISPGYSPPEQIAGGFVGPAADFYALGRTFVHLLTARYPADLEDSVTGVCRWRGYAKVSIPLATLLDQMMALAPQDRPQSAREILTRLTKITRRRKRVSIFGKLLGGFNQLIIQPIILLIKVLGQLLVSLTQNFFRLLSYTLRALLDTFLAVIMAGLGGVIGAGIGFWLVYGGPVAKSLTAWLSNQWEFVHIEPALLLFATAGLGTALGITESGSFAQDRRFWRAGFLGILGYIFGWFFTQSVPVSSAQFLQQVMGFSAITTASITLGLGLQKHHLLHSSFAAMGSAFLMAFFLASFRVNLSFLFNTVALEANFNWQQYWSCILFFSFLGGAGSCCLGGVYYVLIPILRLLGFR